jgi:hypothetical protein
MGDVHPDCPRFWEGDNVNLRGQSFSRLSAGSFCLDDIRKIEVSDDIES